MHRQPAAGARVAPAISILHAAPFQCGCKAQGAAVASGRPAGTQKGGMHFAAAPAGAYQAPPQRSVYPSLTPICSRSPPARPAQSKRTHAAYAPGCSAGFDTGPGALCTQAAPRYAAAALRHGPRRASARTRLMRRDAARALTLGPAQKRRPYAGKPAPPCRSFSIHGPACRARPYSGKRTRRIFYRPSLAL